MTAAPFITLHDGNQIPQLGLGVWQVSDAQAGPALAAAFEAGYRAIDTAAAYNNEDSIGKAIKASGLARDKLFITTKLWNDAHGYDATLKAFDVSLKNLQLDYVDLYLIHWPVPKQKLFIESWRAFAKLKEDGRGEIDRRFKFQHPPSADADRRDRHRADRQSDRIASADAAAGAAPVSTREH